MDLKTKRALERARVKSQNEKLKAAQKKQGRKTKHVVKQTHLKKVRRKR